jgi:hypothetical protein
MIVILASRYDARAGWLASRWADAGACLLTCEDLSVCGWRYDPRRPLDGTAVLGGRERATKDIRGVLTRLSAVTDLELTHIVPADRAYVAAEMTAFLTCWLSTLPCPVLNPPTPVSLTGPNLRSEQWALAAARLGMALQPAPVRLGLQAPAEGSSQTATATVTVVGDRAFGDTPEALRRRAIQLARATEALLLGVSFSSLQPDARFTGVTTCPDVDSPEAADAVLELLTPPAKQRERPHG